MIYPLREEIFSGNTYKAVLSIPKLVGTRKNLLQGLIIRVSRDLPLEREKVFSGTLKKALSNGLTSGGVLQVHPLPSPEKEVIHQLTTE